MKTYEVHCGGLEGSSKQSEFSTLEEAVDYATNLYKWYKGEMWCMVVENDDENNGTYKTDRMYNGMLIVVDYHSI